VTTSAWTREQVAAIALDPATTAPVITPQQVVPMLAGYDLWDLTPVRTPDGEVADIGDREVWVAISAPAAGDPGERHDIARLRLLARDDSGWRDLGDVFPDGASLGGREWAGSAIYRPRDRSLTVYYTAAGRRGERTPSYVQRIAAAAATVEVDAGGVRLVEWTPHREVLRPDGATYAPADEEHGVPGFIKAFRDPFMFRDPADGVEHLLFTASLAGARSPFNGAVGIARSNGPGDWTLLPPLLGADGVNNELERTHVVVHDGLYYLFFSTQRRTFDPVVTGPNGLYGFVASALLGPYEPLNRSGLVVQNPPAEPLQAYSWLVLNDLRVSSFVDSYALGGSTVSDPEQARRHFGGTLAPELRLRLEGRRTALARDT
jgi:levansucrase